MPSAIRDERETRLGLEKPPQETLCFTWCAGILLLLGATLRIGAYLAHQSLWLDEAALANNILQRSFAGLTGALEGEQYAPIGFLFLEKAFTLAFGGSEYVLRLIPLLGSLAALFLFYKLARRCLPPCGTLVALFFFAFSWPLIHFGAQVKQYSTDCALSLAVVLAALYWRQQPGSLMRLLLLALAGAVGMLISHPLVFILAGIGSWLFTLERLDRRYGRATKIAAVSALWLAGFLIEYVSFTYAANPVTMKFWTPAFAPLPFDVPSLSWYYIFYFEIFNVPVGLSFPQFGAWLSVLGYILLYKADRRLLALLLLPLALVLLASAFGKYPFAGRLLIFAAFIPILLLAGGINWFWQRKEKPFILAGAGLFLLLAYAPVCKAVEELLSPARTEDLRPVLRQLAVKYQRGDYAYVFIQSAPAVRYYSSEDLKLKQINFLWGIDKVGDSEALVQDLKRFKPDDRVWLIMSHTRYGESRVITGYLSEAGELLDRVTAPGAGAYLYRIKKP